MCSPNHTHVHADEQKEKEDKLIHELTHNHGPSVKTAIKVLRGLRSPVDVWENVPEFQTALKALGIHLKWGLKASYKFAHAYTLQLPHSGKSSLRPDHSAWNEGNMFTILTDLDLDDYEEGAYIWHNVDLFREEV